MNQFDPAEVDRLAHEIEESLADLAHIDRVLAERTAFYDRYGDPWGPEEDLLGTDVPVGTRHPFEIQVYGGVGSSWRASSLGWRREAEAWAHECVQSVRHQTRHLIEVDTSRIASIVDNLQLPSHDLGVDVPLKLEHDVQTPMDRMWRGEAKDSFDTFLSHAIGAITRQGWLLEAIRLSLVRVKNVADMSQIELVHLLRGMATSLDEQLRKRRADENGSESWILFFLFASTATGVLGAITLPKALDGLSTVLGVSSPLLGAAKDAVPQSESDYDKVPARTAREYSDQLHATMQAILEADQFRWDAAHAFGAGEIRQLMVQLGGEDGNGGEYGRRAFVPPMPSMAEGPVSLHDFAST
jgi:hypothetical protein